MQLVFGYYAKLQVQYPKQLSDFYAAMPRVKHNRNLQLGIIIRILLCGPIEMSIIQTTLKQAIIK